MLHCVLRCVRRTHRMRLRCAHQADGFMGIIQKECCPAELCEATATSIAADCRERWGAAPPIEVHANDRSQVRVRVRVRVRAGVRARVT